MILRFPPKKTFFLLFLTWLVYHQKYHVRKSRKNCINFFLSLSRYRDSTSKKYDRNRFFRFFRENVDIKFNLLKIYDSRCHITLVSKICVYKYPFKNQFYSKTFKEKEKSMMQHPQISKGKNQFHGKKIIWTESQQSFSQFFYLPVTKDFHSTSVMNSRNTLHQMWGRMVSKIWAHITNTNSTIWWQIGRKLKRRFM